MKKHILLLFIIFLHSSLSFAQTGRDFIICIDNSGSIMDTDFKDITINVNKLIEGLLNCNSKNRVSVVHYGTGINNTTNSSYFPRIYIESDFTNNISVAQNFTRKLSDGDHFHEILGLIGNALDNISNINIVSPQTTLNHNPAVPLVVILYTDGFRSTGATFQGGSYLVNFYNPTLNSSYAFSNMTSFKATRSAKFIVIHKNPDTLSSEAAASISSFGGYYNGNIELYQGDPEFGKKPRLYFPQTNFNLDPQVLDQIIKDFCSFNGSLEFLYEQAAYCTNPSNPSYQTIAGKFLLPLGGSLIDMKLFAVNTTTNAEIPVNFNPTINGNTFSYYIQPNDIYPVPTSGNFNFRVDLIFDDGNGNINTISSWNNYPDWYFTADIVYDGLCSKIAPIIPNHIIPKTTSIKIDKNADPNKINQQTQNSNSFELTPNPNNGIFSIVLNTVTSGEVEVFDMNAKSVYLKAFKNKQSIDVNLQSLVNGTYIIKLTKDHKKVSTTKFIKK